MRIIAPFGGEASHLDAIAVQTQIVNKSRCLPPGINGHFRIESNADL